MRAIASLPAAAAAHERQTFTIILRTSKSSTSLVHGRQERAGPYRMFSRFHMTLETSEFGSGCICGDPIQLDTSILLYIHATQGTYNSKNCYRRRVKFILEGQDSPLFFILFPDTHCCPSRLPCGFMFPNVRKTRIFQKSGGGGGAQRREQAERVQKNY